MTTQEPKVITNKSKTKRQDDIHLWLTKSDNLRLVYKQLEDEILSAITIKYESNGYIESKYHIHKTKTTVDKIGQFTVAEPRRALPVGNGSIDFRLRFGLPIVLSHDRLSPMEEERRGVNGNVRYPAVPEKHSISEEKKLVTIYVAGLIKPDLESIDRAMKQINKYIYNSEKSRLGDFVYLEIIITYDENDRYDSVLEQEDIQVVRIPEPK
jgi:hypothetical protein